MVLGLQTFDRCNLVLQDGPIYDKRLHLDHVRAYVHGKRHLARIGHGFLHSVSFDASLFQVMGQMIFFFSGVFPHLWP